MLTVPEQLTVTAALENALATIDVSAFVTAALVPDHLALLKELPRNLLRAPEQAVFVVSYCLDSRWQKAPSLLERLLTELINGGHDGGTLTALRTRVAQKIDPNPDPANALWLNANIPFLSRTASRPLIGSLLNGTIQPILRVLGPDRDGGGCGKSYTRELLDHVCENRSDLHLVPVEIPKGMAASYSADAVAEALVSPTTTALATKPPRATSGYASALCRWVLNAATNTPGKWVYLLDGFGDKNLPAETCELVQALAAGITIGDFRRRFRLVLVDYAAPLPSVHPAKELRDNVPAATAITAADLVACLDAHYKDLVARGANRQPLTPADLIVVADGLLAQAPADPAVRLGSLNTTLTGLRLDDLRQAGLI
jgi:hypothetical protein